MNPTQHEKAAWRYEVRTSPRREAPAHIREALLAADRVSDVADGLRNLGYATSVDFGDGRKATSALTRHAGPVLTAQFYPRRALTPDNCLGYDLVAGAVTAGDVLIIDAARCDGSGMGGSIAASLQRAGVSACAIDGRGRDYPEIDGMGLPMIASAWGVTRARDATQLGGIGVRVNFYGRTVEPDDYVVMSAWGAAFIPACVPWSEIERILKL